MKNDEQERSEARYNRAVKDFQDGMEDAIDILIGVFKSQSAMSPINRNELKAILLEDIEEMI